MVININSRSYFVFDLDDTLIRELDFVHSGFRHIAEYVAAFSGENIYAEMLELYDNGSNVFEWVMNKYPVLSKEILLELYRNHEPAITLRPDAAWFLKLLAGKNVPAGLVTDGRSRTQRNKLKAVGLENYFTDVIISEEFGSEKPDPLNFHFFVNKYPGHEFTFFGDNTTKDFIVPLHLGWKCFCLKDSGSNIHKQSNYPVPGLTVISSFNELIPAGALVAAEN